MIFSFSFQLLFIGNSKGSNFPFHFFFLHSSNRLFFFAFFNLYYIFYSKFIVHTTLNRLLFIHFSKRKMPWTFKNIFLRLLYHNKSNFNFTFLTKNKFRRYVKMYRYHNFCLKLDKYLLSRWKMSSLGHRTQIPNSNQIIVQKYRLEKNRITI